MFYSCVIFYRWHILGFCNIRTDGNVVAHFSRITSSLNGFSQVAFAQQYGALGVILYNDPIDYVDKSLTNSTFPNSWFLPPTGAQRGTLAMTKGDKLTEGYPAKGRA